jgi:hypothetical protein
MVRENTTIVSDEPSEELLGRPVPSGVRDLGTRHYEAVAEWSQSSLSSDDSEKFTADQHAALAAQAVTEAESTLADEMGAAEAALAKQFGTEAVIRVVMQRVGNRMTTEYFAAVCVGSYPDYRTIGGKGASIWEAADDLRAVAAGGLPATVGVA